MRDKLKLVLKVLIKLGQISLMLLFITGCWTVAYYFSYWLYNKINWTPHHYVAQLLNLLGGFFLMGLVIQLIGFLFFHKRQKEFSNSMRDALRRIAQGDFKVRLNFGKKMDPRYTEILDEINLMADGLEKLEVLRQEFISDVSHEIQTPLTSISGFARALQNESLESDTRIKYLRIIEGESSRLSKLSENLLRLASLDSEKHPFEPKRYRLDRQLGTLILSCEPQWTNKSIDLNADLDDVYVHADEDLLSQVWINLISNSIKFTPEGGQIDITLRQTNGHAEFRIKDTGIGIAAEQQEQIFQRFFKSDKARSRKIGGSGLGLSLVKKIVEMHHGNVVVESELGQGSVFIVTLPTDL
ncbi:HAMP domain-containing histidine kinase [Paenibacillus glycanilyticus]|uniref:sensor histidine kinase n=1 Tax=Paenibacillus glycanilyticus TaxID=126569 RepID=UPI00203BC771|nr:HAMP domain-containing sensor histidine kinase [Paenibacillus glycanilyticus]MCM3627176.1 HAMP domain-containing histidine kinase [Paenibacillus glycanilyticus]